MENKIRLGVIGCSNFLRKRIIDAVSKCEYGKIVCLASRDIEKAKKWADEFNIESYDSYEGILKRDDIDAIYIPLPISLHKEWAIKSAENGKHVICEKSLSYNFKNVAEIIKIFRNKKLKLTENIMIKNHNQHYKIKEMVKEGKIGKIFSLKSSFGQYISDKENIRYKKELNNGVLNDIACYPIFISKLLFNEEPINVECDLIFNELGVDVKGTVKMEFLYGKIALFDFGFDNFYQNNYSIWGSEGIIKANRAYSIDENLVPDIDYEHDNTKEKIIVEPSNQYKETFEEFFLDILKDRESNFEEILETAKVMEACRISAKENRKVFLNKNKVVAVSGYFDPIHAGHLELFELSKRLGDKLIVILNNDEQIIMKRSKKPFMNQEQRKKIIESIKYVDEVFISIDKDRTVCESLKFIKPDIFANGGDRHQGEIPEAKICKELGIEMVDGQGAKIASSRDYYLNN